MTPGTLSDCLELVRGLGGTDLLLTAGTPPTVRVDGALRALDDRGALDGSSVEELLAQLLTPAQLVRFRTEREIDFSFGASGTARVRANAYHQRGSAALALRVVPDEPPSPDELGVPPSVQAFTSLRQGLVLLTGPTGSGKSTTMAALVALVNDSRPVHILTIEDPIEYLHPNRRAVVSQREIGTDSPSFARALRSALREDPDVILLGEMRDPESIAIALTLAETGHLVLSTLHTNDAAQALDRIVDVFPSDRHQQVRTQLAGCLAGVVAQRLVPRIGGGIVAAFEVMTGTTAVRNLLREGHTRQLRNVVATSRADGMQTLESDLRTLLTANVITPDAAHAAALHPKDL